MNLIKQVFNFYINASIHVALAVYSLVRVTEFYFGLNYNESLNYFIFYGTITGYNFVKYFGIAKFHHRSLTRNLKVIQLFSLLCFIAMLFYAWQLSIETLLFIAPFGLLTVLYAIPFLSGFQKNLRNISFLKIIIIALVWSGVTVLLPVIEVKQFPTDVTIYHMIQRFLLVCVLILPFDIRDMQYDAISLQTIPQKIGIEKTKKLGYVLLLFTLVLEFIISSNTSTRNTFLILFFVALFFLMRATKNQSKYYSSFWVESIPILWFLLLNYSS
jgi:4-hydroxybenzoate polyprenyltransferase